MFGLILAIGIVVDDAIIVLENVERLMSEKLSPREAAVKSDAGSVGAGGCGGFGTVIGIFADCFLRRQDRRGMYKQFSVTIAVSVLISAFVALTLTPALCALIIKPVREHKQPHGFFKWFDNFFDAATELLSGRGSVFLKHRKNGGGQFSGRDGPDFAAV